MERIREPRRNLETEPLPIVEAQEHDRSLGPDALIAVDEGVALTEMEQVRGCDCRNRSVQVFPAERRLWSRGGGFEHTSIPQSMASAEQFDLVAMDFDDFVDS